MPRWTLACLCLWSLCGPWTQCAHAATVTLTLEWTPSQVISNYPPATSYRVYQSVGLNSFSLTTTVTTNTAQVGGVDTGVMTRFFVTGVNANGSEGGQSNTVTNYPTATPPPGQIVLTPPVLSVTNVALGGTIGGTATLRNLTGQPFVISEAGLTARRPGVSNIQGPYDDWTPTLTPQTVPDGASVAITASWVVPTNVPTGQWRVHFAVKSAGVWNDGPDTFFTVVTNAPAPLPPPMPPTNLRIAPVTSTRVDLFWTNGDLAARTEVEERKEQDAFKRIVTVSAGTATYVRTNLRRHRDYAYRVRATKNGLVSDYSNVVLRPAM